MMCVLGLSVCACVRAWPMHSSPACRRLLNACVPIMTVAPRGLKVKVTGQGQRSIAKCVRYIYCCVLLVWIDCDVISCELAGQGMGVQRSGLAAAAEPSACARGNAVGLTQYSSSPRRLLKAGTAGCMFCFCFLFLTIPIRQIIAISTGPIFAKFSGLVELWSQMISSLISQLCRF